jgi:membrane-bound metal-dependent hydrolase YbcI (DUF457 family)
VFVGHYGPSFAAKAMKKAIPLWVLFVAVQFLDVLWSIFVLLGIEKVRIVPGITATNPLDLYYMPYTHSLIGAILWSLVATFIYYGFRKTDGYGAATFVGAAVFSHWVLDVLVHRPDMPLYDNSFKIGLGLWNYPLLAFLLEIAFMFSGMYFYLKTTQSTSRIGRYGMVTFGFAMVIVQFVVFFGPPLSSDKIAAITALFWYFVFAAVAYWLEKKRVPRTASEGNIGPAADMRHAS